MSEASWFFALAPKAIQESPDILRVSQRLRRTAKEWDWDVKWTSPEQFHITLAYVGPVTEEQRAKLFAVGEASARAAGALDLDLKDVGAFPELEAGRVVWIGVRRTQALVALFERLTAAIALARLPPATEDFVPHVTLGRLRHARHLGDWLSPYRRQRFGEFHADRLGLFTSHQYGPKIVYKLEAEWELCVDNARS